MNNVAYVSGIMWQKYNKGECDLFKVKSYSYN